MRYVLAFTCEDPFMKRVSLVIAFLGIVALAGYWKFSQTEEKIPYNYKGISEYQKYSLDKPDSIMFCGEIVPVTNKKVQKRLDEEMYRLTYYRHNTRILIKRANYWFPRIEPILKQHNIPDDFKYMAVIESGLSNVKSNRGAAGFWQFIDNTGRSMGLEINNEVDERYDPIKATHAACRYLNMAYKRFENWTNVAASYNMGIGGVERQIRVQHVSNYYDLRLNKETARYLYKMVALKELFDNSEKYGFPEVGKRGYGEPLKSIKVDTAIVDLKDFAENQGVSIEELKEHNPWIKSERLTHGTNYTLKIPIHPKQRVEIVEDNDSTTIIRILKSPTGSDSLPFDSIPEDSSSQLPLEFLPEGHENDLYLEQDSGTTAKEL